MNSPRRDRLWTHFELATWGTQHIIGCDYHITKQLLNVKSYYHVDTTLSYTADLVQGFAPQTKSWKCLEEEKSTPIDCKFEAYSCKSGDFSMQKDGNDAYSKNDCARIVATERYRMWW